MSRGVCQTIVLPFKYDNYITDHRSKLTFILTLRDR